jgi:YesN/AraC family two-component response regulator
MGDPDVLNAENGLDALELLEKSPKRVDCVIADFNMPVMHGLQLLKRIRMGTGKIQRHLPVIMLTGHGDTILVKLAIELDVNSFVLKPVTKESLGSRLLKIMQHDRNDDSYIKSVMDYKFIDVDSPIVDILDKNASSQVDEKIPERKNITASIDPNAYEIENLRESMVLARNVTSSTGQVFIKAGTGLTRRYIEHQKDLKAIGILKGIIYIK